MQNKSLIALKGVFKKHSCRIIDLFYKDLNSVGITLSANLERPIEILAKDFYIFDTGLYLDMNLTFSESSIRDLQDRLIKFNRGFFSKLFYKSLLWLEKKSLNLSAGIIKQTVGIEAQVRPSWLLASQGVSVLGNSYSSISEAVESLKIVFYNVSNKPVVINPNDNIAALVFQEILKPYLNVSNELLPGKQVKGNKKQKKKKY